MNPGSIYGSPLTVAQVREILRGQLGVGNEELSELIPVRAGMTNITWSFRMNGQKYLLRLPGAGTEQLINRKEEYTVYQAIADIGIGDEVVYFDAEHGMKISRFLENVRTCSPGSPMDIRLCMEQLRWFHEQKLTVPHSFDLAERISYYERLRQPHPSVYADYGQTRKKMDRLLSYVKSCKKEWTLCHIDAVCDNFLLYNNEPDRPPVMIDWEYAAMQDPHLDIAMFLAYSDFTREQADQIMDYYFIQKCPWELRQKIYCYIALCGFLWSNWCEFKRVQGEDFGEYAVRQYELSKVYYDVFMTKQK